MEIFGQRFEYAISIILLFLLLIVIRRERNKIFFGASWPIVDFIKKIVGKDTRPEARKKILKSVLPILVLTIGLLLIFLSAKFFV